MGEVDTDRLFARARSMSELFTSPKRDLPKCLPGLLRGCHFICQERSEPP
jgi:hypothetical protein